MVCDFACSSAYVSHKWMRCLPFTFSFSHSDMRYDAHVFIPQARKERKRDWRKHWVRWEQVCFICVCVCVCVCSISTHLGLTRNEPINHTKKETQTLTHTGGMAGAHTIELTEEEANAIQRLEALGFDRQMCLVRF